MPAAAPARILSGIIARPADSGVARLDGRRPGGSREDAVVTHLPVAPDGSLVDLFEKTADMVHRTAWRITGRPQDAEDVVQAVFLNVLRSPPSPWPDHPAAYVHRAAVNASLDILRARRRTAEVAVDETLPSTVNDARDAHARIDEERLAARLQDALSLLSPLEAEVFSLRFFEERSNAEIAEMIGKTTNHVGVTLHAARKKLREALAIAPTSASPSGPGTSTVRPPEGGLRS